MKFGAKGFGAETRSAHAVCKLPRKKTMDSRNIIKNQYLKSKTAGRESSAIASDSSGDGEKTHEESVSEAEEAVRAQAR